MHCIVLTGLRLKFSVKPGCLTLPRPCFWFLTLKNHKPVPHLLHPLSVPRILFSRHALLITQTESVISPVLNYFSLPIVWNHYPTDVLIYKPFVSKLYFNARQPVFFPFMSISFMALIISPLLYGFCMQVYMLSLTLSHLSSEIIFLGLDSSYLPVQCHEYIRVLVYIYGGPGHIALNSLDSQDMAASIFLQELLRFFFLK